jgi:hypothetical protein
MSPVGAGLPAIAMPTIEGSPRGRTGRLRVTASRTLLESSVDAIAAEGRPDKPAPTGEIALVAGTGPIEPETP